MSSKKRKNIHAGSSLDDFLKDEGISYRFNEKRWSIHFNQKDGWICIGDISFDEKNLVEFVSNCIGVINKQKKLTAIWLSPRFL